MTSLTRYRLWQSCRVGLLGLLTLTGAMTLNAQEEDSMQISSPAFEEGAPIPQQYTCEGVDVSPALSWTEPPAGTKSFAVLCDDPDAPVGTWVHWVLYNLPADTRGLAEDIPKDTKLPTGGLHGTNDFGRVGYGGPCPPPGPAHRYLFKLYALDGLLTLPPGATKAQLEEAMEGHILGRAELIGRYQR